MVSNWISGLWFIGIPIVLGLVGLAVASRLVSTEVLRNHNDIAAPIHAAIGVIYAVLLAFVVVTVWENHDSVETSIDTEANQIAGLDRDIAALPDTAQAQMHRGLVRYAQSVIDHEWKLMEHDSVDGLRNTAYDSLWGMVTAFRPESEYEHTWLTIVYRRMNQLDEARSRRFLAVEQTIPKAVWGLMIFCGAITILFACFFGAERKQLHRAMVSALAAVIGVMLFVIAGIDHPFTGIVRVEPEAFRHALETLRAVR